MADEKRPPNSGRPEVAAVWAVSAAPPDTGPPDGEGDFDDEPDSIFEGESEADDFDEDGIPIEDNSYDEDGDTLPPPELGPAGTGALDDSQIYKLSVFSRGEDGMGCEYEASWWHEVTQGNPTVDFAVCKRSAFLRGCAAWLEGYKSPFLQSRALDDFFTGETSADYRLEPLVTAKGFMRRVNQLLPTDDHVPEYNFSKILPHIWLIWEDGLSMPLAVLFSEEFKVKWVVEGCKCSCADPTTWQEVLVQGIMITPKAACTEVPPEAFESLPPAERCRYLFRRTGLRAEECMKGILEQLAQRG